MTDHADLDLLADVVAGEAQAPAHLSSCAQCRQSLDELRAAQDAVRAQLAALPDPPLPADLAERLSAALAAATPPNPVIGVTMLPARRRSARPQWLAAAAAVVLLLGGVTIGVTQLRGGGSSAGNGSDTAAAAGAPVAGLVRNDSGTDYTDRASLAKAVPQLLAGTAQRATAADGVAGAAPAPASGGAESQVKTMQAPEPLGRLRTTDGLADCLAALLPPEDPSVRPLALDYGSYRGTPALVVILPSAAPKKLDVFVVGAGCTRADAAVLFYASVDAP